MFPTTALTLATLRTTLTAPAHGRHRRPRWARRAATTAMTHARFILGIPEPDTRYQPTHASPRRASRPALA